MNQQVAVSVASLGNENERVSVTSGFVVAIDQFMLANKQFLTRLFDKRESETFEQALEEIVGRFGGCVFPLSIGEYGVYRDVQENVIAIHRRNGDTLDLENLEEIRGSLARVGRVIIDTRCLVFTDRDLFADRELLDLYARYCREGEWKRGRDLLREKGAAVRYGFSQQSDTLIVHLHTGENAAVLWPE